MTTATGPPNEERWKGIDGFAYDVSDYGRVRRRPGAVTYGRTGQRRVAGGLLHGRPNPGGRGHLRVRLSCGAIQADRLVHRLVLEAFYGPLPPGYRTAWLNGDVRDNRLDNLVAWAMTPNGLVVAAPVVHRLSTL
jgi:hypothetical protein